MIVGLPRYLAADARRLYSVTRGYSFCIINVGLYKGQLLTTSEGKWHRKYWTGVVLSIETRLLGIVLDSHNYNQTLDFVKSSCQRMSQYVSFFVKFHAAFQQSTPFFNTPKKHMLFLYHTRTESRRTPRSLRLQRSGKDIRIHKEKRSRQSVGIIPFRLIPVH